MASPVTDTLDGLALVVGLLVLAGVAVVLMAEAGAL